MHAQAQRRMLTELYTRAGRAVVAAIGTTRRVRPPSRAVAHQLAEEGLAGSSLLPHIARTSGGPADSDRATFLGTKTGASSKRPKQKVCIIVHNGADGILNYLST